MLLKEIDISNYKNIKQAHLTFSPKINCLIGLNGMGKTNLLDAIYYLSFLRGHFYLPDHMVVCHNEPFCLLDAHYLRNRDEEHIVCSIRPGHQKVFKRNKKAYTRLSEHIGRIPLVMISPKDFDLVHGGSEERRKYLDTLISQEKPEYLEALIAYKRLLEQRNSVLKSPSPNVSVLDILEEQIAQEALLIQKDRIEWIKRISLPFTHFYNEISGNRDNVSISYLPSIPHCDMSDILATLQGNRKKDLILGYTSQGVHKDDIGMYIDGELIRKIGSQGQNKTFLIALKLAQYTILKETTGLKPLLLLDDLFDKLDAQRVDKIVHIVTGDTFGQIFMTDTNRAYLDRILKERKETSYHLFSVEKGGFSLIASNT
ncbi:MAG: DNA replication and repair protein RecF [Porphyromonas sp.]|nr:DNA replication and repair protein RecF [Porphyromonas sp.]